jgi:ketosteroid isomerase-like protein
LDRPAIANAADADVALVLAAYAAFARGDIDAAIKPLHPDVEWIEPDEFPNGGRRQGPMAVAEYLRASRAMWHELVSEPTAYRRGKDIVVVHHVHGRTIDGEVREATVTDVYTVKGGQVVRMRAFTDLDQAFAPSGQE